MQSAAHGRPEWSPERKDESLNLRAWQQAESQDKQSKWHHHPVAFFLRSV